MAPGGENVVEVSGDDELGRQAKGTAGAVFAFMEALRPKAGVFSGLVEAGSLIPSGDVPPYVYVLGEVHGPAFTVRDMVPAWEPPVPRFGAQVAPAGPPRVEAEQQEIPEAFRRR